MKPFTLIAVIVFILVAVVHLARAVLGLDVRVGSMSFPVWASVVAAAGAGLLAAMVWRENRVPRADA
jgi:hypothetical protein